MIATLLRCSDRAVVGILAGLTVAGVAFWVGVYRMIRAAAVGWMHYATAGTMTPGQTWATIGTVAFTVAGLLVASHIRRALKPVQL